MQLSSVSLALLAASLLAGAPAIAQPASNANATQKQPTDSENPSVGPGSGAYKEYSDPKGWDADARAWHKQHTDARDSIGYTDHQQREADKGADRGSASAVKH